MLPDILKTNTTSTQIYYKLYTKHARRHKLYITVSLRRNPPGSFLRFEALGQQVQNLRAPELLHLLREVAPNEDGGPVAAAFARVECAVAKVTVEGNQPVVDRVQVGVPVGDRPFRGVPSQHETWSGRNKRCPCFFIERLCHREMWRVKFTVGT